MKQPLRLVVKPGPRPGWGRIDLPSHLVNDKEIEFYIEELKSQFPVTGVGRYNRPCVVFQLKGDVKIGSMVKVERRLVFKCQLCGKRVESKINGLCDKCYNWSIMGDMVSPPYAALIRGRGG